MFMANLCHVYGEFMSCLWRIYVMFMVNLCHVYGEFMSCLWRIYVTGNTKSVHVKGPVFFIFYFNQIWSPSTHFQRSPIYQISRKSIQWEPR